MIPLSLPQPGTHPSKSCHVCFLNQALGSALPARGPDPRLALRNNPGSPSELPTMSPQAQPVPTATLGGLYTPWSGSHCLLPTPTEDHRLPFPPSLRPARSLAAGPSPLPRPSLWPCPLLGAPATLVPPSQTLLSPFPPAGCPASDSWVKLSPCQEPLPHGCPLLQQPSPLTHWRLKAPYFLHSSCLLICLSFPLVCPPQGCKGQARNLGYLCAVPAQCWAQRRCSGNACCTAEGLNMWKKEEIDK